MSLECLGCDVEDEVATLLIYTLCRHPEHRQVQLRHAVAELARLNIVVQVNLFVINWL